MVSLIGPSSDNHGGDAPDPVQPDREQVLTGAVDAQGWDERGTPPASSCGQPSRTSSWRRGRRPPAGRALDLAAGEGRNAIWLARRAGVTAADFPGGARQGPAARRRHPGPWVTGRRDRLGRNRRRLTWWSSPTCNSQPSMAGRRPAAFASSSGRHRCRWSPTTDEPGRGHGRAWDPAVDDRRRRLDDLAGEALEVVARRARGWQVGDGRGEPGPTAWDCLVGWHLGLGGTLVVSLTRWPPARLGSRGGRRSVGVVVHCVGRRLGLQLFGDSAG